MAHGDASALTPAGWGVCEVRWRSFPYPTPPSYLHFLTNIYDQLDVNHSLIWKHMAAGKAFKPT